MWTWKSENCVFSIVEVTIFFTSGTYVQTSPRQHKISPKCWRHLDNFLVLARATCSLTSPYNESLWLTGWRFAQCALTGLNETMKACTEDSQNTLIETSVWYNHRFVYNHNSSYRRCEHCLCTYTIKCVICTYSSACTPVLLVDIDI